MFSVVPRRKFGNGNELYPFPRLRNEFETIMNRFFGGLPEPYARWGYESYWGFKMEETDKEFLIRAEAPGFELKEFEICLTGNLLTLKAEHKPKFEKEVVKEEGEFMAERCFERYITLPSGVLPEKIEAFYKNGILEVHVPKCEEVKPLTIPVKA
jgi:HSP20 family protein